MAVRQIQKYEIDILTKGSNLCYMFCVSNIGKHFETVVPNTKPPVLLNEIENVFLQTYYRRAGKSGRPDGNHGFSFRRN